MTTNTIRSSVPTIIRLGSAPVVPDDKSTGMVFASISSKLQKRASAIRGIQPVGTLPSNEMSVRSSHTHFTIQPEAILAEQVCHSIEEGGTAFFSDLIRALYSHDNVEWVQQSVGRRKRVNMRSFSGVTPKVNIGASLGIYGMR